MIVLKGNWIWSSSKGTGDERMPYCNLCSRKQTGQMPRGKCLPTDIRKIYPFTKEDLAKEAQGRKCKQEPHSRRWRSYSLYYERVGGCGVVGSGQCSVCDLPLGSSKEKYSRLTGEPPRSPRSTCPLTICLILFFWSVSSACMMSTVNWMFSDGLIILVWR